MRSLALHSDYVQALRPGGKLEGMDHLLAHLSLSDFLLGAMILCLDLTESRLT